MGAKRRLAPVTIHFGLAGDDQFVASTPRRHVPLTATSTPRARSGSGQVVVGAAAQHASSAPFLIGPPPARTDGPKIQVVLPAPDMVKVPPPAAPNVAVPITVVPPVMPVPVVPNTPPVATPLPITPPGSISITIPTPESVPFNTVPQSGGSA